MPAIRHQRRGSATAIIITFVVIIAVVIAAIWYFTASAKKKNKIEPIVYTVKRAAFEHVVSEQGEVESSSNIDIACEVKSRNSGGTAVLWVIEEGSQVKEGDLLCTLDASALEDEGKRQNITVSSMVAAKIQSESALEQAKIGKKEYLEGTFKQEEKVILSEILVAKEKLSRSRETVKFSEKLAALGFLTQQQLDADLFAVEQAAVDLDLAEGKLKTLREITKEKMLVGFNADIAAADAKLQSDLSTLTEEQSKAKEIREQIAKCEIKAPTAGQVVHANKRSSRGGAEFVLEAGAVVRERQAIIRLPDPDKMQVKALINESAVPFVRTGMPVAIKIGAFDDGIQGRVIKVNKYAEPTSFFGGQVKEYATYIEIVSPPEKIRTGMTAEVRIFVERKADALVVPVQALHEAKGHMFVLKQNGNDDYDTIEIEIQSTNDEFVSIDKGIAEGDKLVMNPRAFKELLEIPENLVDLKKDSVDESMFKNMPKIDASKMTKTGGRGGKKSAGKTAGRGGPGAGRGGSGRGGSGRGGRGGGMNVATIVSGSMDRYDGDKDGKITMKELTDAGLEGTRLDRMKAADTNGDGEISRAELTTSMTKMIQQFQGRGGGGGGGPR